MKGGKKAIMTPHAPLAHVDIGLLAHQVGKPAPHSLDGGQGKHDFLPSIDIRVQHTKNMLKLLTRNERLLPTRIHDKLSTKTPKP
jgi:hypothetical protein